MTSPRATRWEAAVVLLLAGLYLALCLPDLGAFPPVFEDEPWLAASAWKLARDGIFGSDLFAGLYGLESRSYIFPPVQPLLLAATFRVFGVGLLQARLATVTLGLVALLATYALGRRLGGPAVGGLGALSLLVVRTSFVDRFQGTGILFLDTVRIARYDAVVPAFALLAAIAASHAAERRRPQLWALAGFLVAIASLTNLYALFLVATIGAFALWERAGRSALAAFAGGFLLPWIGYAAYAASDLDVWLAQTRYHAPRFQLLDPNWYLDNLTRERWRYSQGFGAPGWPWLARPTFWAAFLGIPITLARLIQVGLRVDPGAPAPGAAVAERHAARLLVLPALLLPPLYALLLWVKVASYRAMLLPFNGLVLAWGLVALWRWSAGGGPRRSSVRAAIALLAIAATLEASGQLAARHHAARATTPHDELAARLRAALPAEGRILALHHYWFGLEDRDFRTWYVPLWSSRSRDPEFSATELVRQLDAVAPAAVVLDPRLRLHLDESTAVGTTVRGWLRSRHFRPGPVLHDRTYGELEVFLAPTAATPAASTDDDHP